MAWTKEDDKVAVKQGWALFEAHGKWEIERIDEKDIFQNDIEAFGYVKGRASMGCKVAKKALRMDGKSIMKQKV